MDERVFSFRCRDEDILAEIGECSERFRPSERVQKVLLIDIDFTTDNGMLTPTLKIRRDRVLAAYGDRLLALYDEEPAVASR